MKILRKPKLPVRSNPPVGGENKPAIEKEVDGIIDKLVDDSKSDELSQQWATYNRVGDRECNVEKEEDIWEYHKRTTGKELEKPIVTVYDAMSKSNHEIEELADGHDMNLEGLDEKHIRTAILLYVTGQKKMAYKMADNYRITTKNLRGYTDDRVQSQETV